MPTTKNVMYDIVKPWYYAPEVWKAFLKFGFWAVLVGFILAVYVMGENDKKAEEQRKNKAQICGQPNSNKPVLYLKSK